MLVLTETDVTATEDPVLREVALGGPDGAARTRILQHIRRVENSGGDCRAALLTDEAVWAAEGLTFDAATARLLSLSRLEVTFDVAAVSDDPCEPSAKGGYLGADNQAIRIQIAAVNQRRNLRPAMGMGQRVVPVSRQPPTPAPTPC